ncbi:MAG TPA: TonB-dependent receptor, partial [Pseudomonadota bacterium]|nr:TonB-dependent receptor [Pseudomonadota bacterium]
MSKVPGSHPALVRMMILLVIAASWATARPALATVDGLIRGTVSDDLIQPIPGATVTLRSSRGEVVTEVQTAADGSFTFTGVALGEYILDAKASGHLSGHQHLRVGSGEVATAELYCARPDARAIIVEEARLAAPSRAASSVSTLTREALKLLPKGEDLPITEVVSTQAGFIQDAFGNVYARGNHAGVQYQIDGIPIPDSVGNLFAQAIPVRLIDSVELLTGGLPAEYGNRLAAVVNISSRTGGAAPEGLVQLRYGSFQTLEPSVYYSRSIGRFGFFVGGSYLQSQRALDPPAITPILHDDGRSGRAFFRADWRKSDSDRFELFGSYAHNFFQIPVDPTSVPLDPLRPSFVRPVDAFGNSAATFFPADTDATETENEVFLAASWVHSFAHRGRLQVAPYYKLSIGALAADAPRALGATADPGSTASDVTRRADHIGGIVQYSALTGKHQIKTGFQIDYLLSTTDFTQYVRDDIGPQGGVDPAQTAGGTDRTGALLFGAYVQDRWDYGRTSITLGVRVDEQHVILTSGETHDQASLSPRIGASFAFLNDLVGRLFFGLNWQPPSPLDAANAARLLGVVPATMQVPYDVLPETALYGEAGLDGRIRKRLRLGVTGWGRYAYNQLDDVAIGATNLIANYNFQRGRAVGVEGKLELSLSRGLSAFGNVSWEIAQGQGIASAKFLFSDDQLASQAWETLDHVQTWTANLGATVQHGPASLTALLAYGSGLRTGPDNSQSVPEHVRIDTTLSYSFDTLPLRPRAAIDIINLLDAHYAYRLGNGFVGSSYAAPRTVF